jgi:hypothetical protein
MRRGFDGALCGLAQEGLQLGEDLLDGVQVGRVGRQEDQVGKVARPERFERPTLRFVESAWWNKPQQREMKTVYNYNIL